MLPGGLALLEQGAEEIRKRTKKPVTTASHAVHEALRAFDITRISVVTPFDEASNEHVRTAFAENGFDVAAIHGAGCTDFTKIGHTGFDEVRRLFDAVDAREAQALVQVGTGLPLSGIIGDLESAFAKPVIGCNAAAYWQALRGQGIADSLPGKGRLFSER